MKRFTTVICSLIYLLAGAFLATSGNKLSNADFAPSKLVAQQAYASPVGYSQFNPSFKSDAFLVDTVYKNLVDTVYKNVEIHDTVFVTKTKTKYLPAPRIDVNREHPSNYNLEKDYLLKHTLPEVTVTPDTIHNEGIDTITKYVPCWYIVVPIDSSTPVDTLVRINLSYDGNDNYTTE